MRRLRIAIDVDDVLAENAAGFVAFSNQRWGTSLGVGDYDEHWAKMWGVDNAEVERRSAEYSSSNVISGYGHIGGAYDVLKRLSKNHHLVIATSRNLQMKSDTLMWIDEHFPGIFNSSTIHFAGIWDEITEESHNMTKADLITQINADVLIDDQLKHCIAVAESGRHSILFGDYEWNKSENLPDKVLRCLNWMEVEQGIEKISNE
ncbi:hypothetical protein H6796_01075 [Candidatus Nomurabacteria bacterium]|nr:hypothetical protein [Candidatus Nomurabacteria bacterium]